MMMDAASVVSAYRILTSQACNAALVAQVHAVKTCLALLLKLRLDCTGLPATFQATATPSIQQHSDLANAPASHHCGAVQQGSWMRQQSGQACICQSVLSGHHVDSEASSNVELLMPICREAVASML